MNETIRIATVDDAESVTALTKLAYSKWVPLTGRKPLPMTADHAAHIRDYRTDLLFVENELAAVVEMIRRDDDILIENVAVAPHFQKRGYGRKMIGHVEQLASEAGLRIVRLYTNSKFEENLRLYTVLGYKIERNEDFNGGIAVHMMKILS